MKPVSGILLAAGFGTRMGALTANRPKPLLTVQNRALIDHGLDRLREAGAQRVVVNLHYRGDQIRAHLAATRRPEIIFSEEQPNILDTGGGIRQALHRLGPGPFYALNSDAIWIGPPPLETLARHWGRDMEALLLLVPRARARGYTRLGDFFVDANRVPSRRGEAASAPYVYTGAQIVSRTAFIGVPEGAFSMNLIWDRLLAEGRLRAAIYKGAWVDVGTPEGLAEAEAALLEAQE